MLQEFLKQVERILAPGVLLISFSCVTPQEERQMKQDIARLQTQVIQMQNLSDSSDKSLKNVSNKRAANANTRMERISIDIQKIKGELDALRVGVVTGQLPGQTDDDGPSMAKKLSAVIERLEAVEENQRKVLEVIEKSSKSVKSKSSKSKGRKSIGTLSGIRAAFKDKRYRHVKEDAPKVIRKFKKGTKNRREVQYLYAESLYKLGDIKNAALEFDEYLKSKPKKKVAHANLRLGDCFRHLGEPATAKIYYDEIVSSYANSEEAKTAAKRLEKLRI